MPWGWQRQLQDLELKAEGFNYKNEEEMLYAQLETIFTSSAVAYHHDSSEIAYQDFE